MISCVMSFSERAGRATTAERTYREGNHHREICSPGSTCSANNRVCATQMKRKQRKRVRQKQRNSDDSNPSNACLQIPQVSSLELHVQVETACQLLICSFISFTECVNTIIFRMRLSAFCVLPFCDAAACNGATLGKNLDDVKESFLNP